MAWIETGANNTEPKPAYRTMTVILNLNTSDPTQWAVYDDDAMSMEAGSDEWDEFFGHYPCILENGVELGKLDRNDFSKYEDGTTAPITTLGKDVMICFPRRGIKIEYIDNDNLSVSMTNEDNKEGYSYWAHSYSNDRASTVLSSVDCDKFYLGAYKGYNTNNYLYSVSGQTPTTGKKISSFRQYAHNHGIGYEQSGFFQLTFRQVMYLLKYKGQNAQIAIGRGYVDGNSAAHVTGGTNTRGMDWGESTGKDQMKLFGLEDFYGNVYEFIDGIWADSNRKLWVADGNYNDTGTGYTDTGSSTFDSNINGYLRYPVGTNLAGFNAGSATYSGTDSTYFCDNTTIFTSRLARFGGKYNDASLAGVFSLQVSQGASNTYTYVGSRLMYMHVAE